MASIYCVVGATRGTGLQIARQLIDRGDAVRAIVRDVQKARGILGEGCELRRGDVTERPSLGAAGFGDCRGIFFAVDITEGITGRGVFKSAAEIRAVTYQGLVNTVEAAKGANFQGRFVLLSGMGSELPSPMGRFLNFVKGNLQGNQRDRDEYLRVSGLAWSIGRGGMLTDGAANKQGLRVTEPIHPLSLAMRLTRADFARALIVAADQPAAANRSFDIYNDSAAVPDAAGLAAQFMTLGTLPARVASA